LAVVLGVFSISVIGAASFALSGVSMGFPLYSSEPFLHKKVQETPIAEFLHSNPDSTSLVFAMSVS
jgi:hypothetical protein